MSATGTYFFEKLLLLSWKSWQVVWNNRGKVLISVLTPSLFALILVFMRFHTDIHNVEFVKYEHIIPEQCWGRTIEELVENQEKLAKHGVLRHTCYVPKLVVAYAPNNTMYGELMSLASTDYLNNIELKGFQTVHELRNAMRKEHFFAGIGFNDVPKAKINEKITYENVDRSLNLDFSLVFPSELRFFNETFIGQSWKTREELNYDFLNNGEKSNFDVYVREGFISLQHGVSMAFIKSVVEDKNLTKVVMERFPRIEHEADTFTNKLYWIISLIILVGYLYPCINLAKRILREKECNVKNVLEILGISETINFLSWFMRGSIALIFSSILVVTILKIKWNNGFGICNYSSWLTIFYLLVCYNVASVTFCFLICSAANNTASGLVFVIFFWFITYLPFTATWRIKEKDIITKISILIFSNTAMGLGFNEVIRLEEMEEGLQWNNLFRIASPHSTFSVGTLTSSMILMSIIYSFLGIYMNLIKRTGIFLKNCIYKHLCPTKSTNIFARPSTLNRSLINYRKSRIFAIESQDKKVIVELQQLTKIYGRRCAIYDMSMSIYQGEITVIMGHNGAGKTTLLSMVAGFVRPTSGTTLFEGVQLRKRFQYGLNIGACFHTHQLIFPDLTVASNIVFYSRLKGLTGASVQQETKKYLNAMNLNRITDVLACNLSTGLRQNLSICCALCGRSKYVILDEPSADMDAVARKNLWQLLIQEKQNRTIIITTNSTEEAEVLADRLAILSGGLLMCYGSPYFLKTIYGRGYRLICLKSPECDSGDVTAFLKNQIPNITIESEIGIELSYRISEGYGAVLPKLLSDLEESFSELRISSCSFSEPCVEDIFLRLGAEDPGEDNRFRQNEIMSGLSIYLEQYDKLNSMHQYKSYKGFELFLSQVSATFWKRYTNTKRKNVALFQYAMPALVTILTFMLAESRVVRQPLRSKIFRMTDFPESVTVVAGLRFEASDLEHQRCNLFLRYYENLPFLCVKHKVHVLEESLISDFFLEKERIEYLFNKKYIVGASYDIYKGRIYYALGWYNNYYLHSAPLSLNLIHNGLLASRSHKGSITVHFDPLPFTSNFDPNEVEVNSYAGNYLPLNLTFIILIVYSSVLLILINERTTRFKLLQYIFGMRTYSFWLGSGLYDFFRMTTMSMIVFAIILVYEHSTYDQCISAAIHLFLLVYFGLCLSPFYYLASSLFNDSSTGFILIVFFNLYGVLAFCAVMESLGQKNINQMMLPTGYSLFSSLVPYYALSTCLTKVFCIEKIRGICMFDEIKNVSILVDNCKTHPNCCNIPILFDWNNLGVLPELSYLFIFFLVCTLLLTVHSYRFNLIKCLGITTPADKESLALEDYELKHAANTILQDELINEATRVQILKNSEYRKKPLIMSNVSKIYGDKKVAVNRMTLLLERCECFGLLGANGSGKSSVLKMLVGDEKLTCGRVYVDGISLTDDISRMYKHIGYCPYTQSEAVNMTCREMLSFFCRVRGIPTSHIAEISDCLVKVLGVVKHYDRKILLVSSGLRRRLGTAIALIGNPSILYLDGHCVNIDPAGRRQIWNIICRMCAVGKTVMLTTHDALDCERFCTRCAVINNGQMVCLDTVYNLHNRYIQGYVLQVKLKIQSRINQFQAHGSQESLSSQNPYLKVMSFVENEFSNSTVRDQSGSMISFLIPLEGISLSIIYKKIQRNAFLLNIESFSITRDTLSLLFADLVEKGSALSSESS